MNQTKTQRHVAPVDEQLDPEVISFRAQFDQKSPLDEIIREGARRMLQSAIDAEVEEREKGKGVRKRKGEGGYTPAVHNFRFTQTPFRCL